MHANERSQQVGCVVLNFNSRKEADQPFFLLALPQSSPEIRAG
jgi:hypothetical protein